MIEQCNLGARPGVVIRLSAGRLEVGNGLRGLPFSTLRLVYGTDRDILYPLPTEEAKPIHLGKGELGNEASIL